LLLSDGDAFGRFVVRRLAETPIDLVGESLERRQIDSERHPRAAEERRPAVSYGPDEVIRNVRPSFKKPHRTPWSFLAGRLRYRTSVM
jgi:hypothetical protein